MSLRHIVLFGAAMGFSLPTLSAGATPRHAQQHAPRNAGSRAAGTRTTGSRTVRQSASAAETIEVAGTRRAFAFQAEQHRPDAATLLTGEQLRERGILTLRALEYVAPNLTIQSINGTASTNFYLRGLGFNDFTQSNMGPVLAYYDDVPYAYSTMATGMMFDLANVTVMPGPVGTEHGQSDTGGEILFHTNDPTDSFHAGASEDMASYARSRSEAYVSGPLARGLSFRIAGQVQKGGGWQTDPLNGAHLGDADLWALRAKLKWQLDSRTTVMLTGHVVQDDSEVVGGIPIHRLIGSAPLPTVGWTQTEWSLRPQFASLIGRKAGLKPSEHDWFWGADLNIAHDFGFATLRSISAFETMREQEYTDQDATAQAQADTYRTIDSNAFTQELRLSNSDAAARFQWAIGAFYQRTRMNQRFFFDYTDYLPARGYMQASTFGLNEEATSEFAHVSYRLPHDVKLFGGLLHEIDDRGITGMQSEIFGGRTKNFHGENTAAAQFAGQVGVSWQATQNVLVYYKMSKGFKPGGFTANNTQIQAQLNPFKPESVLTYELGFKSDLIHNVLRVNGAAFYNDFHNQQILGTILIPDFGPLSQLTNVPKSESWGFEGTVDLHVLRHVFLTQNFGWQRGTFQDFPTVNRAATNAYYAAHHVWKAINDNFAGVNNGQPKLTLNGQVEWRQAISQSYGIEFGPNWVYRDAQALTPGGTGFYRLPPYFLLGAHVTLHPVSEKWQITLYASNILNRHYYTTGGQATTTYFYIPGAPRFIGGRISYGF
ncbi:TonB-dependent receptor [Acidomonas methanolica]|uniref:TonB-dependent receptor n=1 Tax=Acidomonas methanolica TaxID=437 RepID=UPI0005A6B019|nr:TonB-dependent receptor [Acidomonas methanolica]TCS27414.1 outer membrane receptor protein involved in Fe transport [Acidomonas methanolica]